MANASPYASSDGGSAQKVALVTPSDSVSLGYARALLCSVDMTLKIVDAAGNTVAGVPFQKGYNPIAVQQVFSTGSTLGGGVIYALS